MFGSCKQSDSLSGVGRGGWYWDDGDGGTLVIIGLFVKVLRIIIITKIYDALIIIKIVVKSAIQFHCINDLWKKR